ncbi:unnamed protein product [Symbiodinium necroappetens]|uniref:SAM domain-containing protein n=1 Tax=Symbiodinium necroappetens TaxID=1628268 RepID=A0A812MU44_9DINO|nr:unnamed protein product [Symbiodinium necroappetens]
MSTTSFEVVEVESHDGASEVGISRVHRFPQVLQNSDVVEVEEFIRNLQDGVDPFKTELADSLQNAGNRVMRQFRHLAKRLTQSLQVLCEVAEQCRDNLGVRTARLLERSALAENDRVNIKAGISQMEKDLFENELFLEFRELVQECEEDFSDHQQGYDQSISQQESKLVHRHLWAERFANLYAVWWLLNDKVPKDVPYVLLTCSALLGSASCRLPGSLRALVPVCGLASGLIWSGKMLMFGKRTDFDCVRRETEDILNNVRDVKRLGSSISRFYQELKKDMEIIQSHRAKFRQLSKQVDFLAMSDQDVKSWDAETLSVALRGWNLPACADTFLENGISGYAFCNDLNEQDFMNMGIENDLTLRRLKSLQANAKEGKQEFYCPDAKVAAGSLKKAVQDVVDCISRTKAKYCRS